jgi:hypothetical protein
MNYTEAFKNTDYIVNINDKLITINIGKTQTEIDNLIKPVIKQWAFITAYNPLPKILSDNENKTRNKQLRQDAENLGFQVYTGYGIAKDKSWKEDSFLIVGINKKEAKQLGVKYGQLAIVVGNINDKSELIEL